LPWDFLVLFGGREEGDWRSGRSFGMALGGRGQKAGQVEEWCR